MSVRQKRPIQVKLDGEEYRIGRFIEVVQRVLAPSMPRGIKEIIIRRGNREAMPPPV